MAKKQPRFQKPKYDRELEQSYHKAANKPKKKTGLVITIIVLLLAIAGVGFWAATQFSSTLEDGIIMENISVGGVNVGGMTKEEAASALRLSLQDSFNTTPMTLIIGGQQVMLEPSLTEASLDVNAAVEAAYALGRTGSRSEQKEQQLLASTVGINTDILNYLSISTDGILAKLNAENISPNAEVTPSSWEVVGDAPDLAAEELPDQLQTLLIHKGSSAYTFQEDELIARLLEAYAGGEFMLEFECETTDADPVDLDALYLQYHTEPVEPVMDNETFEVSDHAYGYGFDLESAKTALSAAPAGTDVEIPFVAVAPLQTKGALSGMLFRDVLSSHKATAASNSNRNNNLKLACKAVNGTVILPGEVFDYNKTTGQRTTEKGYLPANGYSGDETVPMVGGGVCQPSSVIYYCALLADMEIVTRSCHRFISSYMDPGMDATVSWGGPHFRFRNNTDYPIRIDASASGGSVTISIVGTDTKDYYVKMEHEIISKNGWTTEYVEMEKDNEDGYKDGEVITTPYTGYTVKTYRCRYSKADDSLIERVFEDKSVYSSRNKKIAKIIDDETTAPTEPPVTDPPTTDPPTTDPPTTDPPTTDPPTTDPPVTDPPESSGESTE